jgi:hypothetical protein
MPDMPGNTPFYVSPFVADPSFSKMAVPEFDYRQCIYRQVVFDTLELMGRNVSTVVSQLNAVLIYPKLAVVVY